eukprot:m51a1_g12250 hypothetical protein (501) ;mRNA; r:151687-153678
MRFVPLEVAIAVAALAALSLMAHHCDRSCGRCTDRCSDVAPDSRYTLQCTDVAPDQYYTCAQQASWGKCHESFMQSYCDLSCGRCTSAASESSSHQQHHSSSEGPAHVSSSSEGHAHISSSSEAPAHVSSSSEGHAHISSSSEAPAHVSSSDAASHSDSKCAGVPTALNGKVWAVGVNYAQHSWSQGWMSDFMDDNWASKFDAMKRELSEMRSKGARVVRWWIFATSDVIPSSCWSGSRFVALPPKYVDHIEEAVNYAKRCAYRSPIGLLVYPSLMSFDWGKGSRQHQEIFTDAQARQSWIDNAIAPIVERLKGNSGVFGWDLCNEPEWIIDGTDGGDPCSGCSKFRLAEVKALFNGVLAMIRAKGAKQPVSLGSASLKFLTQLKLWNDMDLDFWDFHWYSWATQWFNPLLQEASKAIIPAKPVIIGEVMPDPAQDAVLAKSDNRWCDGKACTDHGLLVTQLAKLGYSGYLPWAWTDPNFVVAPHISNHFVVFQSVCPAH